MLLFLPLSPSFTLSGTKMARWDFSSLRMWRVQLLDACNLHFSVSRHRKVHLRQDPDFRVKSNPDAVMHLQILAPIRFLLKLTTSSLST